MYFINTLTSELIFKSKKALFFVSFLIFSLMSSSYVTSANLKPNSNDTKIVVGDETDLIQISKSTTSGVSFNSFSSFDLLNYDLVKLINNASLNNSLRNGAEADIITIEVDNNISLNGTIELAGKPAELVLISSGSIECNSCDFKNFTRVTLATGKVIRTSDSLKLSKLNIYPNGISINGSGLHAPSVAFLDILGGYLEARADISTNISAINKNGEITPDLNGQLSILSGNTRISLGKYNYDYTKGNVEQESISESSNPSFYKGIAGTIRSGSVSINVLDK